MMLLDLLEKKKTEVILIILFILFYVAIFALIVWISVKVHEEFINCDDILRCIGEHLGEATQGLTEGFEKGRLK